MIRKDEAMNSERRKRIREAVGFLETAKDIVTDVCSDEQNALDNMPENLQWSDRYTAMEDAVSAMEDAVSSIDEAQEYLEKSIE